LTLLRQIFWYGAASGCALLADVLLLSILIRDFSVNYLIAATISYTAGASIAYVISIRLAFDQHRLKNRTTEFLVFVALGTVGLVLTAVVMSLAVRFLEVHYLVGKFMAIGCTFTCNFILRRYVLFMHPGRVR
jgi:putative flippase GtrA